MCAVGIQPEALKRSIIMIGREHPRYLELFEKAFSAGASFPARLIKNPQKVAVKQKVAEKEPSAPQPAPDQPSPSGAHQADPDPAKL